MMGGGRLPLPAADSDKRARLAIARDQEQAASEQSTVSATPALLCAQPGKATLLARCVRAALGASLPPTPSPPTPQGCSCSEGSRRRKALRPSLVPADSRALTPILRAGQARGLDRRSKAVQSPLGSPYPEPVGVSEELGLHAPLGKNETEGGVSKRG